MALLRALVLSSLAIALSVSLPSAQAHAQHPLAPVLKQALEPGVRVVVVEFYAHWCTACKADAPKWNALRKRYGPEGLRVVTVNSHEEDPSAACAKDFPIVADRDICDVTNEAAKTLGVTKSLPQAFVWSWRGELLGAKLTFEEAARLVQGYLDAHPRVKLVPSADWPKSAEAMSAKAIRGLITQELLTDGRFEVVSDDAQRQEHARLRKKSHAPGSSDAHRCQLDAVVEANSVLEAALESAGGGKHLLKLELSGAERSCVIASVSQEFDAQNPLRSVRVSVSNLLTQLRRPMERLEVLYAGQAPAGAPRPGASQAHPPADQGKGSAKVHFTSAPPGALVEVDGVVVCNATPCDALVPLGLRDVSFKSKGYDERHERLTLTQTTKLNWTLIARVGTVTLEVEVPGLDVLVDGSAVATTPTGPLRLEPGRRVIALSGPCHERVERTLQVTRGGASRLSFRPQISRSSLELKVFSPEGQAVIGEVSADGVSLGDSSGTLSVPLCTERLKVFHQAHGAWEGQVALQRAKVSALRVTLKPVAGSGVDPEALFKKGLASLASGDRAGAITNFAAAAKLGRTETYGPLVQLYVLESRWEECAEAIQAYLLHHPDGPDATTVRSYRATCQVGSR